MTKKQTNAISAALCVVTIALFILKMTICPALSWWGVLAPVWIPCAFGIIVIAGVVFFSIRKIKK